MAFTVIHGYFWWKPTSACSNSFFSSPVQGWRRVMVTGVLSVEPPPPPPDELELPPPQPVTANTAAASRSATPQRLMRVSFDRFLIRRQSCRQLPPQVRA